MKKQAKGIVVIVTFLFIAALIIVVASSIESVKKQTEKNCFTYLEDATKRLADDLYKTTDMDSTVLTAMASIIASENDISEDDLCNILNSYDSVASYINYTEILRPDNTMLDNSGEVRDVSDSLDFKEESAKGVYVSNIEYSTKDAKNKIIRNAVPVVRDGQTIYVLYGVVDLSEFAKEYTTNIYSGNVYVYLIDGNTGDFLLDTWHKKFGNLSDFYGRKMLSEENFADAAINMKQGLSGNLAFVSQSTGDTLYMHYSSVGINNWNVAVTVQDKYAMADSESVNRIMYRMSIIAGILILGYMLFVIFQLLNAYHSVKKVGLSDKITELQNRNAYDVFLTQKQLDTFELLACIYVDVNGLHEINNTKGHGAGDQMLRAVADALKLEFPENTIFRVGGDEFVIIIESLDEEVCKKKMSVVSSTLNIQGYSIAYGVVSKTNATGCSDIIKEADARMLENKKVYYLKHDRRSRD